VWTAIAAPLVIVALAIPLIAQKVPPNVWYGFRTRKTLSSPEIWYPANRRSGIYLLAAGLVTLAATVALRGTAWSPERSPVALAIVLLGPVLAALAASLAYLRKL
jgi:uncharacterized membrane protein